MAKKLDKVDVVIVGTGWAGSIPAAELAKEGYQVVSLERGNNQTTEDFIGAKDELRYSRRFDMMQDLTIETITSRDGMDQTALPVRTNENALFGTGTGGKSVHWNGATFRWWPYDFEIRSQTIEKYGEDKIPDGMTIQDWGITYDELEPYYDQFEKTAGISGEARPIGPERSSDYPNPPMKDTMAIRLFKETTDKMGYHPYMRPSANMSQAYENPDGETINACVYCAFCETYGCDFGAKSSPIVTVLPTAQKTGNHELRNNSYVTRVVYNGDKATGVIYQDVETGEEFEQPADLVVLAGFMFTNTRLLLLSGIGEPYNPETKTGIIGKNITGHDGDIGFAGAMGYFDDQKFNNFMGAGALGADLDDYSADRLDHGDLNFIHGFNISVMVPGQRPIQNNPVPSDTPTWGKAFKEKSLYYANRHLSIGAQIAHLPWDHNYMDLDPTYKDVFGDPLLRITRQVTQQDLEISRYATEKTVEILEEMGADIIEPDEFPDDMTFNHAYTSGHYGGGAIMGESEKTSAVNNYSQMWNMDNLFVVGSSSFPHFGNYNPGGTIGAFAYRAAEGMIKYLQEGGGLLVESK